MSDMNISRNILMHRKRIGFTQNELAGEQLVEIIEDNEVFSAYRDDISFKNIVHNLRKYIGGEKNEQ